MPLHPLFRSLVLPALLAAVGGAGASEAAMVDLGTLGGSSSHAWGVNASGQIVGRSWTGSVGHAFLHDSGVMTDLGSLAGPTRESVAQAINSSGQVAGTSAAYDSGTGLLTQHAFLYSGGVMTDLGTLGAFESHAFDINDDGDVVGFLNSFPGNNVARAFLYSDGAMTNLGILPGAPSNANSMAYAVNNGGDVVGRCQVSGGVYHAFVYSNGTMADLGTLAGAATEALDINDSGQIVGSSVVGGYEHAFLYDNGVMTDLGTLGGWRSVATGIDNYGNVVGWANTALPDGSNSVVHAFLYRDGVMHDLGALGGGISQAYAIGDGGRVVGYSYTSEGLEHAFAYDLCSHDGILDVFEECDDGDAASGDGCNADCRIEQCWSCSGEPSSCTAFPAGTSCDDGLFCTGADTCDAAGVCQHGGDPCPGTQCSTCQEVLASCFDPFGAACTIGGVCGVAVCSGGGSCDVISLCEGPYGALSCSDTTDNDADALADAADPDCQPVHEGPPGDATCTNGEDDDRDGQVDASDRGCLPDPPEVCNGFDDDSDATVDEGFPDHDADGVADCVDQDEDNDGVVDREDNCPLAANPAQADADFDGSGDACDNNVPPVINTPSSTYITVDGQFEPAAGEWADVEPVSYLNGSALVYTSLDPGLDTIFLAFDFSLGTDPIAVGDEVGPISFQLGNDTVVDVFVRQGGANSNATAHPASSIGGSGDSIRMLLNGNPFDASSSCITGAVDFNSTSPSFPTGHNVVELAVRLFGHAGGCYYPGPSFWSVTLPGVQPGGFVRSAGAASVMVSQSFVEIDPDSGDARIAPIGADAPVDPYKCYSGSDRKDPPFEKTLIQLTDEFESKSTVVSKAGTVCVPAATGAAELHDSTANMGCYKIKDTKGEPKFDGRKVEIRNALGSLELKLSKAAQLCMPVRIDGEESEPSIENFKCYKASDLKSPAFESVDMPLADRFMSTESHASKPSLVCNPVDVGQGIANTETHLACYRIQDAAMFGGAQITTIGGFGPLSLELKKSSLLCLPSSSTVLP